MQYHFPDVHFHFICIFCLLLYFVLAHCVTGLIGYQQGSQQQLADVTAESLANEEPQQQQQQQQQYENIEEHRHQSDVDVVPSSRPQCMSFNSSSIDRLID